LTLLEQHIVNKNITIFVTDQLLTELKIVTSREKLKKYFPKNSVKEFFQLLEVIAENIAIEPIHFINRDPKDNFLLDLFDFSKADYLVTGDKDLLEHNPFKTAKIITPSDFEKEIAEQ
jgi:uncharacterized protein